LISIPRIAVGVLLGLVGGLRELDAAGLAAAARLDLRLDDDDAELLGGRTGLFRRGRDDARRDRDVVLGEELLRLEFHQIHCNTCVLFVATGRNSDRTRIFARP
jgi:hypothetical protein